ncbi:hypothetical protein [Serratia liquefaciens]|uniref:hypothetical protein n=1 Tax=Serratia liquefaciens TaxID=614 RepID=UPI00163D740C|nr:hypothetical protein [Serratia liquefaciens]
MTILILAPQAAAYRSSVVTLALLAFFSNLLTAGMSNPHTFSKLGTIDSSSAAQISQKSL